MQTAIVSSKEILDPKKNPTLCLSPARYTGNCVNCKQFKLAQYKSEKVKLTDKERLEEGGLWPKTHKFVKRRLPVEEALKRLKCKPYVSEKEMKLLIKRDKLYKQKEELNKTIDEMNKLLKLPVQELEGKIEKYMEE